jgi:hypothetical protein
MVVVGSKHALGDSSTLLQHCVAHAGLRRAQARRRARQPPRALGLRVGPLARCGVGLRRVLPLGGAQLPLQAALGAAAPLCALRRRGFERSAPQPPRVGGGVGAGGEASQAHGPQAQAALRALLQLRQRRDASRPRPQVQRQRRQHVVGPAACEPAQEAVPGEGLPRDAGETVLRRVTTHAVRNGSSSSCCGSSLSSCARLGGAACRSGAPELDLGHGPA